MIGVVKAGVTGKTHDVMVAKAVFWRLGWMGGFAGPVLCWCLWLSDLELWTLRHWGDGITLLSGILFCLGRIGV